MLNGTVPGIKHNESIRMFSFNMRYLGPRAYEYMRSKFGNTLPHSSTIRKWFSFSNANSNGGFVDACLQSLKKLAEQLKADNKLIYVSINFDEMSIRRHVQWLNYKKLFSGFINFGTTDFENDPLPVATNALVVMLNGINVKVTLPIAYYFINSLIAEEKAIMIASILKTLTDIGIRVVNITADGLITNLAAFEILGADLHSENLVNYFINPSDGNKVYIYLDAPHMIKLVRSCLGDKKTMTNRNNQAIEWKFIERLYRLKQSVNTHKLTKRHIDFETSQMNVKIAVQTLSNSVAQSIKNMNAAGAPQFAGSEATSDFITRFNNLFDIFNSDENVHGNIYKSPINSDSKTSVFEYLDDMVEYIDGLRLNKQPIVKTKRSTCFTGFKINIKSLKMMVEEFLDTNLIPILPTVSLQQDYLESFFARMRSGNGNNTNPNQQQFNGNFRRTLMNKELTCNALSNCVDKLDILTVSSAKMKEKVISKEDFLMVIHPNPTLDDEDELEPVEDDDNRHELLAEESLSELASIAYVAGQIERSIEKNKKFGCDICSTIFELNEKVDSSLFVKQRKNQLPCESTVEICRLCNRAITKYLSEVHESRFVYDDLVSQIKIETQNLFNRSNFDHDQNHKIIIIDTVVEEMIRIRCQQRARILTSNLVKSYVRSAKTHDIHFMGQ